MKILYLTTEGFDSSSPNNQMAMVLIRDLVRGGHEVHLVQSHRSGLFPDVPDMLSGLPGLTVDTVPRRLIDRSNFVVRYLDEVSWAFRSWLRWRHVRDVDAVLLQSCPTAVFSLLLLKLFSGRPVVFNSYDVWPGHAVSLGVMRSRLLYGSFRLVQKLAYSLCSRIVVLSDDMELRLVSEGVPREKLVIIPAWYDDESAMRVPDSDNRFLRRYGISDDRFIVQFAGTVGYVFNYPLVLDAAELLQCNASIRFRIVGDGAFKDRMVSEAGLRGLTNIEFYPLQPVGIVPDVYNACDVFIIPLRRGVIGNGVPSKTPLLMAAGKVIINSVEEDSSYSRMFRDHCMGVSVPPDDARALADSILYLHDNPSVRAEMSSNAWRFCASHYSSSVCTGKFIDVFSDLCPCK